MQYAIWNGDAVTGVSTQWMAEKLDAGDIILQREISISSDESSGELFEKLVPLGAQVLSETLRLMQNGTAPRVPQDESMATFAPTIKKEYARIDWKQNAREINNKIRAFNPRPIAFCEWKGEPLKIHRAACKGSTPFAAPGVVLEAKDSVCIATGAGALELLEVQPAGKPKMSASDWVRGARLEVGEKLNAS